MAAPETPPPNVQLMQFITGTWLAQATHVAAKLGIADLVKDGPKPVADLATATGTAPGPLYRVLRALAGFGVFAETAPRTFGLTPMAECLRSDVPNSLRAVAVMFGTPWQRAAWSDILHAVRTGEPAFNHVHGMNFFEYCQKNPHAAAVFDEAMTSFSAQETPAVLEAYDFSGVRALVDVAGGHGSLLASILQKYPAMRGVLFDMPSVIDGAKKKGHLAAAAGRCELVGGDFFKSVPPGGDAYLMKHIIHDWSDEHSLTILKNIRKVIVTGGRLLLVEMVIPAGNEPHFGKLLDLEMLVQTQGGKERTEAEYRDLFAAAGFRLTRVVATKAPACVVEGTTA
jgi:hypothetical protein